MHNADIRIKLIQLGKQHKDLLAEVNKRGYPGMKKNQFSDYMNKRTTGPQADKVLALARDILDEWEKEGK